MLNYWEHGSQWPLMRWFFSSDVTCDDEYEGPLGTWQYSSVSFEANNLFQTRFTARVLRSDREQLWDARHLDYAWFFISWNFPPNGGGLHTHFHIPTQSSKRLTSLQIYKPPRELIRHSAPWLLFSKHNKGMQPVSDYMLENHKTHRDPMKGFFRGVITHDTVCTEQVVIICIL